MTMRTRTNYVCECGHTGYSVLSENDQPFSKNWESFEAFGFDLPAPLAEIKCPSCGEAGKVRYA